MYLPILRPLVSGALMAVGYIVTNYFLNKKLGLDKEQPRVVVFVPSGKIPAQDYTKYCDFEVNK